MVDYEGRTALMIAATAGNAAVVEYLLSEKAALTSKDAFGKNAMQNAVKRGHLRVAEMLAKAGAKLGWTEDESAAELCEAARSGQLNDIKNLLRFGADVDAADYDQ